MLPAFSVGLSQTQCSTPSSIDFTALAVGAFAGAAGLTLRGTGEGDAKVSCGDCQFNVSFTADVGGTDDATPPVLFPTTLPGSPFDAFDLVASEPLPATATARLVAEDGSTIDLAPTVAPGAVPLVTDFKKPDVVLPTGVGLAVALDGLVDFAGLQGSADTPLRLALFPTPPLVAEDGFESVTGTTFGGATVISDGPLPPIAGTRSVYFGGPGTPAPGGGTVGTVLRVRLAAKPGAKELAFEYRLVGVYPGGGFSGTIHVGSVGKAPTSVLLTGAPAGAQTTWPDGRTVYVTDVESEEVPLPADVGPEVLVDIESFDSGCGRPAPPLGGMLLDGLRLQ
jgi:hypothetical protein